MSEAKASEQRISEASSPTADRSGMSGDLDDIERDPLKLCLRVARSIGRKADKNKWRARLLTGSTATLTAAIPVCIGLSGSNFWLGKAIPSILAALSALIVALGQIERPHERWTLYRRYQRYLEAAAKNYAYGVAPYNGADRDQVLGAQVAKYELDLQVEWEGLVPSSAELKETLGKGTP